MDRNRRRNLYLWSIDGNFLKTHLQKSGQLVHHPAHCTNHHRYTKNIWIAVESQGVFLFDNDRQTLTHYAIPDAHLLSSICIDQQNAVWIGYNGKGLYYTDDHFQNFRLFQTQEGKTSSPMTRFSKFSPNSITPCTLVPQKAAWKASISLPGQSPTCYRTLPKPKVSL